MNEFWLSRMDHLGSGSESFGKSQDQVYNSTFYLLPYEFALLFYQTPNKNRLNKEASKTIDYSFKDLYSKIRALQLLNLTKGSNITALDPVVFYSAFILS